MSSTNGMTRAEHLQWCKDRALKYLNPGPHYSQQDAMASMMSDLGKHEGLAKSAAAMAPMAMFELMNPTDNGIRRFIEGFN